MIRLHQAVGRSPKSGDIYILRGGLELAAGDFKAARDDAERALVLDRTRANEATELLAAVYALSPSSDKTLEAMRRADADQGLPPDRLALMAHLMLRLGDPEGARETYERALEGGSQLRLMKSDLAFLLAHEGADLNRAEQLATEAANAPGKSLSAVDTLGYVYLRNGKADAAFWQFRFAADHADPPIASYFFHLGLALMELDRGDEARSAFERALAIDPEFPDAGEAQRRLGLLSAGAAIGNETQAETS
jgi:tetratricopeptide (TPR) repeat protein